MLQLTRLLSLLAIFLSGGIGLAKRLEFGEASILRRLDVEQIREADGSIQVSDYDFDDAGNRKKYQSGQRDAKLARSGYERAYHVMFSCD